MRLPSSRSLAVVAAVVATLAAEPIARAGDPEGAAAPAESLFQEGRRLMDQKKYAEACPRFLASYKLAPAVGTLLNLADCYEREGKLASAWARFHEAIGLAQRLGRPDREKTARDRADRLEPRLARLTVLAHDANVKVTLDGNELDAAVLGTPVPVDPGQHTVEATAKGRRAFTTTVEVADRKKTATVEIPALEPEPEAEPTKPTEPAKPATATTEPRRDGGSTQRTLGIVAMGAGAVGIGVGAFFGLRTSSKWSDAQVHCTDGECDAAGVELATDAKNAGTISTIAFVAGGVFVLGGAALFFTAPAPSAAARGPRVRIGVGPGDVLVRGRF